MEYKIITTTEDFAALKYEWQRIENQSADFTFFSTFDYCYTWWEVYKQLPELHLWIIVVVNNNQIVGIAPLIIETRKIRFGFKINIVRFLADGDYHDFLVDKNQEVKSDNVYKIIFIALQENGDCWDVLNLTHISHRSSLTSFLFKSKYNKDYTPMIENPFIDLGKYDSFDQFYLNKAPAKANQYANRLQKNIGYTFEHNSVSIDDCAIIHKMEKNYLNSKGLINRHSLFEDEFKTQFINKLEKLGKIVKFALLEKKSRKIIIYNWGYLKDSVFYSVNTAFDPLYENFRVGRVMYLEMFHHAYKDSYFKILDSGTGRYPWKFEWTSDFNLLYQLNIRKPRSKYLKKFYSLKSLLKNIFNEFFI